MKKVTKAVLAVSLAVIIGSIGFIGGLAVNGVFSVSGILPTYHVRPPAISTVSDRVDQVYQMMATDALVAPNDTSATAGALQGLLRSMGDKYATYFNDTQLKAFDEMSTGSFGGIGVAIGEKNGGSYVTGVYKDSPASSAGILSGDIFRVIDGDRRNVWPTADVVPLVRGLVGTKITVTMLRPKKGGTNGGVEMTFTLTRAEIDYPNLRSEMIGKVGYMRLDQFNANAEDDMAKAIDDLTAKGATSLVLDLRGNPGGLLEEAINVSSLFIKDGVIVRVDGRAMAEEEHRATGRKKTDLPLVLLIDGDSASAAEVTGGALQDFGRATLVGEQSYGKGSVQTVVPLAWGGGIKFTIAHYLTPKKRVIDGIGLTPDVVVKMDPIKQLSRATDTQLKKALEIANQKAGN